MARIHLICTYSEIFSNFILTPKAWQAAVASSSPLTNIGPIRLLGKQSDEGEVFQIITGKDHQLAAVFITEPMFPLPAQHIRTVIYLEWGLFGAPMWIRLRCGFGLGLPISGLEWIYG